MKKLLKRVALVLASLILIAIIAGASFILTFKPAQRPASTERIEPTPERLARGAYLAAGPLNCISCHSDRDQNRYGRPVIGPPGAGGVCITKEFGFDGFVCPPNLTPDKETGLGNWSDGEILRAFREGIARDGHGLAPACPYADTRELSDEDARSVVVYLRSLQPVRNRVQERHISFPMSFFIKLVPKPLAGPVATPDPADSVATGKYLATVSHCKFCHTPVNERYQPLPGMMFAGGMEHKGPWGVIRSPNLTPHATGIAQWKRENFIGIFRAFSGELRATDPQHNTAMPWPDLTKMTDADLGAIYDYLRTVPPVNHVVVTHPAAAGKGGP